MDISRRPHDRFFRAYFSDPGILADLNRFVLPAELVAALDLSTLRIGGGTYIDRALREHFSDIAASVALAPAHAAAEGREEGREKGREEGHREGAQARAREDARRMLAEGLDAALVARVTELPIEVVRELAEPER